MFQGKLRKGKERRGMKDGLKCKELGQRGAIVSMKNIELANATFRKCCACLALKANFHLYEFFSTVKVISSR